MPPRMFSGCSRSRFVGTAIIGLVACLGACGSSDDKGEGSGAGGSTGGSSAATGGSSADGGGGSFSTGVDGEKRPADLTPDEIARICGATKSYIHASISDEGMCRVLAATSSAESEDPVTECQAAYDDCVERAEEGLIPCLVDDGCDVSVAEYEACVEEMVTTATPIVTRFPACERVTPFSLLPLIGLTSLPACQVVDERCGSILPDLGGGPGGAGGL